MTNQADHVDQPSRPDLAINTTPGPVRPTSPTTFGTMPQGHRRLTNSEVSWCMDYWRSCGQWPIQLADGSPVSWHWDSRPQGWKAMFEMILSGLKAKINLWAEKNTMATAMVVGSVVVGLPWICVWLVSALVRG